jgi:uncharacterized repeat protein (TIGR01451 family)
LKDKQKKIWEVKAKNVFARLSKRLLPAFVSLRVNETSVCSSDTFGKSSTADIFSFNVLTLSLFISVVLSGTLLPVTQAESAIISRTITIDGNMDDWRGVSPAGVDITTNSGQFATDEEGDGTTGSAADRDYIVQGTGRDLEGFSYTYDSTNLYMWVKRYASTSNQTDWWFYIDVNNNGRMESAAGLPTDKLLRVSWNGSNGKTTISLSDYVAADTINGDPLVCELASTCTEVGFADGYDMPGTVGTGYTLSSPDAQNQNGGSTVAGSTDGVEMETRISWAALGLAGPSSVGFHISSSNGSNIPTQINDNMNGIGGGSGGLAFSDLAVSKTASVTSVNAGVPFDYTVSVTNNGDSDATSVSLEDVLPPGITYSSHTASVGSYDTPSDPSPGLWNIGSLANGSTATLTITVIGDQVTTDTVVKNETSNLLLDQGDPNSANDLASIDVTIKAAPNIIVVKSAQTIEDPINGSTNPKAIPGAAVLYSITLTNQGLGVADLDSIIITDPIPANAEMFVGNLSAGSPVAFIDGAVSSALSLSFISLASTTDDIEFSSDGLYEPVLGDGYDSGVTLLRLLTKGTFAASDGTNHPSFTIRFKVRIQ